MHDDDELGNYNDYPVQKIVLVKPPAEIKDKKKWDEAFEDEYSKEVIPNNNQKGSVSSFSLIKSFTLVKFLIFLLICSFIVLFIGNLVDFVKGISPLIKAGIKVENSYIFAFIRTNLFFIIATICLVFALTKIKKS